MVGFKVGLTNTAPTVGSALGAYTDCGEFDGSVDNTMPVTITINCDPVGQSFQYVIIDGTRLVSAELCMDEVAVHENCEYRKQLRSYYYIIIDASTYCICVSDCH